MKTLYKYLITFGIGIAMAFWTASVNDIFNKTDIVEILKIVVNALTLPAVVITGIGGLVFASNEGAFDALAYGMTSFLDIFRKEKKNKFTSFYDYKQSREDKRMGFGFLLITGLVFMVLMGIMYLVYRQYA